MKWCLKPHGMHKTAEQLLSPARPLTRLSHSSSLLVHISNGFLCLKCSDSICRCKAINFRRPRRIYLTFWCFSLADDDLRTLLLVIVPHQCVFEHHNLTTTTKTIRSTAATGNCESSFISAQHLILRLCVFKSYLWAFNCVFVNIFPFMAHVCQLFSHLLALKISCANLMCVVNLGTECSTNHSITHR